MLRDIQTRGRKTKGALPYVNRENPPVVVVGKSPRHMWNLESYSCLYCAARNLLALAGTAVLCREYSRKRSCKKRGVGVMYSYGSKIDTNT